MKAAVLLCAGHGTRFRPYTNFLPKPALPLFNLPLALYPAGLLKTLGITDIHYNSHHLPRELEQTLQPYFKNKGRFEEVIQDSAGGIAGFKDDLASEDNFVVANGDTLVLGEEIDTFQNAIDFHIESKAFATFLCVKKKNPKGSGILAGKNQEFLGLSSEPNSLQFIGIYFLNKTIFKFLEKKPSHIFHDVILKLISTKKILCLDLGEKIEWYETGNKDDFIKIHKVIADRLFKDNATKIFSEIQKIWNPHWLNDSKNFKSSRVFGKQVKAQENSDFLCLPHSAHAFDKTLSNCLVGNDQQIPNMNFSNEVLLNSTQWN